MKKNLKNGKLKIGYELDVNEESDSESIKNCNCKSETVIYEELETDLNLLLSSFDTEVFLGIYDGIYYIKDGADGMWAEIPAETEAEAIKEYNKLVDEKLLHQNIELTKDEQNIKTECNRIWESRQQKQNKKLI